MAANQDVDALLQALEDAVDEAILYIEGPGATSQVVIDQWGPRDVFCHFLFWHEATARGMESVAGGGEPMRVETPLDKANADAITSRAGQTISQLVAEARRQQERLANAVHALDDLSQTVLVRPDGTRLSARQRLELIAHHWSEHIEELQAAANS
ncbi:MAG: DinB family protein [SAR202 cluster bacterium]|jgi:hypothetical protein|nr:DinB family protein [SAR202 cluster bacterium]